MSGQSLEMLGLLAPAFFAGLVVASTHVPLGQEVLKRGIIFIDLAIAQIAALGVVVGSVIFHAEDSIFSFIMALIFALGGSGIFSWLEKKAPKFQEPFIGCAFVISASVILLLLAGDPHGGEEVEGLLAGQILWVGWHQVGITALVYAAILFFWIGFQEKRAVIFYILFPVMITLSVQLVGVYLVFASLIFPALAVVRINHYKVISGVLISVFAYFLGLLSSYLFDLPAGPAIVVSLALTGIAGYFFHEKIIRKNPE
ncbi:MAG TPA: metal ABC transporter permease [Alphaproteobacteria bacterium]|nr:metal ABC transporter permease [Alphaproteobacteria bacterium]